MNSEYEIQTVDEAGIPVKERIPTAKAAKAVLDEMIQADAIAAKARASIEGLVDGNKPFSDQKLRDEGQGYRENWNDRQAESIIDARCSADFNMLFDVGQSIEVGFLPGFFSDPRIEIEYGRRVARAYTHVFTQCAQIIESLQRSIRDRVELGLGFLLFPDPYDWRPKAIQRGRCFFNAQASSNCEDVEIFCAVDSLSIADAYERIERAEASEKVGWQIEALKRYLVDFFYRGAQRNLFQGNYVLMFEDLQHRIRSNDSMYFSKQYATLPVVHMFVQERSRRVSQYMIPYNSGKEEEFLFSSFEAHDSMDSVVIPLPYDYGDGNLASVKGLGHRIYAIVSAALRSLMHTMDAAKLATSLLVQNSAGADNQAFSLHRFGPITVLDKNMAPIQTSFTPNLTPSFEIRELLQRIMNNNNGVLRLQQEDTTKSESVKTAEEVRTQRGLQVKTENDRAFLTYLRWDALHQQLFKRLIDPRSRSAASPKAAREASTLFFKLSESLGVPEALYKEPIFVRATRAIGSGSPYIRQQNLMTAKNYLYGSMSEWGKRQLDREMLGTLVGQENIDRFIPIADDTAIPSNEASIAQLETNQMEMGEQVLVGVDQIHAQHIAVHTAAMVEFAQQLQADPMNVDIERAAQLFQQGFPHTMRHIEILASDPVREGEAMQAKQTVEQLVPVAQQLFAMYEKIQQAKQQEIQRLREENMRLQQEYSKENQTHQREMLKIQLAAEAERSKTESLNANRAAKTEAQLQMAVEKLGAKLAMDNASMQQDLVGKQTKLQQEIEAAQIKIQLMVQEAQAKLARKEV